MEETKIQPKPNNSKKIGIDDDEKDTIELEQSLNYS